MKKLVKFSVLALSIFGLTAQAATYDVYVDRADYLANVGSGTIYTQALESYSIGASMSGVDFLPGVNATTNVANLEILNSLGDKKLYLSPRDSYEAYYDIKFSQPYKNFGFNIEGYNPAAPSPGFWQLNFADGEFLEAPYQQTGSEDDDMFIGIISDTNITSIRWIEPAESDFSCCEETAIDDFIYVATTEVPLPAAAWLFGSALLALGFKKSK